MIKSRKQMYLVIGAFALVLMLGTVTYAFFNYTRTGSANTIRTGRIAFNSQQGTAINLTNVFPVDVTNGIPNNNANVGSVTINVTGDTTYTDGIEYLVSATNVVNTVGSGANAKTIPISVEVSVTSNVHGEVPNQTTTTLGTSDSDYFANRGSSVNSSIYKVLAEETIANNDELLVGYIKSGAEGVDGNIVIRAYIDASKVAISDTYPEGIIHTVKTTNYSSSDCEEVLAGVTNASSYCATASSLQNTIDNGLLTNAQITSLVNAGIVEEYTDGTTSSWAGDREVFTTAEWNSLQTNGISFQVKIEANEGIWVTAPIIVPRIASCPGCVYKYSSDYIWAVGNAANQPVTILQAGEYSENYNDAINNSIGNIFLGLKINESTHEVEKSYACGIKGENPNMGTPFCLEIGLNSSKYDYNYQLLQSSELWNNTCNANGNDNYICYGSIVAQISEGQGNMQEIYLVAVQSNSKVCQVNSTYGYATCSS